MDMKHGNPALTGHMNMQHETEYGHAAWRHGHATLTSTCSMDMNMNIQGQKDDPVETDVLLHYQRELLRFTKNLVFACFRDSQNPQNIIYLLFRKARETRENRNDICAISESR